MRIGFISDIHGNCLALESVLAEVGRADVDQIICLGDVAVGPQPAEALERIRALGCQVVMGNWDAAFVNGMPAATDEVSLKLVEIGAWWAEQLTADEKEYISTFRPTLEFQVDSGTQVLCYHGSPTSYDDWIFASTSDDDLARMLGGRTADVMVGGHTHLQMVRRYERSILFNPGSVGLSFSDWWPKRVRIAPWAEYAILTVGEGRLAIELHRTTFDVEGFLRMSLSSGMPHAQWWVDSWSDESLEEITRTAPLPEPGQAEPEPDPTPTRATTA